MAKSGDRADDAAMRSVRLIVGGTLLLGVRGVLLWALVPLATCVWLLIAPWLRRRGVGLGGFLGWVDLNFVALLARSVLRPLFADPPRWIGFREMAQVTHRIGWTDPA
jgi:hypothetical protein